MLLKNVHLIPNPPNNKGNTLGHLGYCLVLRFFCNDNFDFSLM